MNFYYLVIFNKKRETKIYVNINLVYFNVKAFEMELNWLNICFVFILFQKPNMQLVNMHHQPPYISVPQRQLLLPKLPAIQAPPPPYQIPTPSHFPAPPHYVIREYKLFFYLLPFCIIKSDTLKTKISYLDYLYVVLREYWSHQLYNHCILFHLDVSYYYLAKTFIQSKGLN